MTQIFKFTDDYDFLSNSYDCALMYNGYVYNNAESAYQAQKNPSLAKDFTNLSAREAINRGRSINIIPDWDKMKLNIMSDILKSKFNNDVLRNKLISTGDTILINGMRHDNSYWGAIQHKKLNIGNNYPCNFISVNDGSVITVYYDDINDDYYIGQNNLGILLMNLRQSIMN